MDRQGAVVREGVSEQLHRAAAAQGTSDAAGQLRTDSGERREDFQAGGGSGRAVGISGAGGISAKIGGCGTVCHGTGTQKAAGRAYDQTVRYGLLQSVIYPIWRGADITHWGSNSQTV